MKTDRLMPTTELKKARLSRDPRFDGLFYIGVTSTGIFCRPICPARLPKEDNVRYFASAFEAANQGFRPCLRCRPDSAPGSNPWKGTETVFDRALQLIDHGFLNQHSTQQLTDKLGISDRYLRKLFHQYLGASPKQYALYQQCLFAKQLLHQSSMRITDVALASGFNSVRRFNDCFKKTMGIRPSDIRHGRCSASNTIRLTLHYRPPYDWQGVKTFLQKRLIPNLEWMVNEGTDREGYGRTIAVEDAVGWFEIVPAEKGHAFNVTLQLDDTTRLKQVIEIIRRVFDLDANSRVIDAQLVKLLPKEYFLEGLRVPQIWSLFEAGVRAILGQQVSVKAAQNLVSKLVDHLGSEQSTNKKLFPTAQQVINSGLSFLKMPQSRHDTLKRFAKWYLNASHEPISALLDIKGIGPWTVDYIRLRGLAESDVWLGSDLGVKNALKKHNIEIDTEAAKPWRSYLTFHVWRLL